MRSRHLGAATAGCVVAALLAVGWTTPPVAASGDPVDGTEWVADACTATRTWTHAVGRSATHSQKDFADDALTEGPLAAPLEYLRAAGDATHAFRAAVKDAGVPDTDGGRTAARTLVRVLREIETGFRDARHELLPLKSSSDTAAIAAGVAAARDGIDATITDGLAAVDDVLGSGPLARDAGRVKACRTLVG